MLVTSDCATSVALKNALSQTSSTSEPRLYLAGPIRGIPDYKLRFARATERLRKDGFRVFNPVEQDEAFDRAGVPADIRVYLKHDLAWICDWSHGVALLPGWQHSAGAMAEYWTARAIGVTSWEVPA